MVDFASDRGLTFRNMPLQGANVRRIAQADTPSSRGVVKSVEGDWLDVEAEDGTHFECHRSAVKVLAPGARLTIVKTGAVRRPMPVRLNESQRQYRATKIAALVNARIKELGTTQLAIAQRAGISPMQFRYAALQYRAGEPDPVRLGNISIALEWPVQYLTGLMNGTYDLHDDPDHLPDAEPQAEERPKWKSPKDVEEDSLRLQVDRLTLENREIRDRLDAVEEALNAVLRSHRQVG